MKDLNHIKEEYAQDNLFKDWEDFEEHGISDYDLNEIAQRYAKEALKEAAEKAEIETVYSNPINPSMGSENIVVDKESILNIELK